MDLNLLCNPDWSQGPKLSGDNFTEPPCHCHIQPSFNTSLYEAKSWQEIVHVFNRGNQGDCNKLANCKGVNF